MGIEEVQIDVCSDGDYEDGINFHDDYMESPHGDRKSHKQEMEKKRRARINDSLTQLKTLVLQALKKDETRYSKLEKADILEMTARYLRSMRDPESQQKDSHLATKYIAGFHHCTREVMNLLGSIEEVPKEVQARIASHLSSVSHNFSGKAVHMASKPKSETDKIYHGFPHNFQYPIAQNSPHGYLYPASSQRIVPAMTPTFPYSPAIVPVDPVSRLTMSNRSCYPSFPPSDSPEISQLDDVGYNLSTSPQRVPLTPPKSPSDSSSTTSTLHTYFKPLLSKPKPLRPQNQVSSSLKAVSSKKCHLKSGAMWRPW